MPTVECLSEAQLPEWDAFVAEHPLGVIYHHSSWKRVIESSFPHIRGRILVVRAPSSGRICAGIPIYRVKSWLLRDRLVSIPFASICDPLVTDESQWEVLNPAIDAEKQASGNCPFELRLWRSTVPNLSEANCRTEVALHHTIELSPGADAIFPKLSRTAVRRMISKGKALGVETRLGDSHQDLQAFYRLLVCSRRRLGLPAIPETYFRAIWDLLSDRNRSLILALRENKPIAAALSLRFGPVFILEYSGEDDATVGCGAGQMVYWESVRHACSLGCSLFSFGRTSVENTGLAAYKLHWASKEERLVTYWPGSPGVRRHAVAKAPRSRRLIGWLSTHLPPSLYRAMSAFCYRHWG